MRLTLGKKIGIGFATVLGLSALGTVATFQSLGMMRETETRALTIRVPSIIACKDLQRDLNQTQSKGRQVILAGSQAARKQEAQAIFDKNWDNVENDLAQLDQLDSQLVHLDAELNERQSALRSLQKLEETANALKDAKRAVKDEIERLRRELRAATAQHREVEDAIDNAFNPHWGPLFSEGYEVSKFGEQVEAYACVYTSRVSNFRFYSPMQYFRGPRDRMPHER